MATSRTLRALQRGYAASAATSRLAPVRVHLRRRAAEPQRRDAFDVLQVPPTRARSIDSAPVHVDLQVIAS